MKLLQYHYVSVTFISVSILVLASKSLTSFKLPLLLSAVVSGAIPLDVGLEKFSSICEPQALHGCRLRQAVTGDAERTFVLGILSSGLLAVVYNNLFIVLTAATIFGDTLLT